ncbi:MAG TPA: ribokinase [Methylomirabilota bacterium]|nr:ribokinase [Methylomirabilota bacterium]
MNGLGHARPRSRSGRVLVVGSLNIDHILSVARLPRAGETVRGSGFGTRFGGKGANQAVAAARQGARVQMIGAVGDDASGHAYRRHLRRERIDIAGVRTLRGVPTGAAFITVDARGDNCIVIDPGANGRLNCRHVASCRRDFARCDVLLTQFEVPLDAVLAALRCARAAGACAVLNPSPWREDFPWGEVPTDLVIVNEIEAAALFGECPVEANPAFVTRVRRRLRDRCLGAAVVTRGARTTWFFDATRTWSVPTLKLTPVDTVGAGDAFTGALAARLAAGAGLEGALRHANGAGGLATLAFGAQEAIPTRSRTERAAASLGAVQSLKT